MAGNDPVDQDAIAAQWEASLDSEDPTEAAEAAAANELSGTMALQWAAMVERRQSRLRRRPEPAASGSCRRKEIDTLLGFNVGEVNLDDNSGIRAIIDSAIGLLRASADARDRFRPPGAADDHLPAQLHLRQRRGFARSDHPRSGSAII